MSGAHERPKTRSWFVGGGVVVMLLIASLGTWFVCPAVHGGTPVR